MHSDAPSADVPATSADGPGTLSRAGLRRVLAVLCGTEITSWGVLFYAFPVLVPAIALQTGPAFWWPRRIEADVEADARASQTPSLAAS